MRNNESKLRTTLFLTPPIVKHAKAQAILEDITLTELVEKALLDYLPQETVIKKVTLSTDPKH